MKFKKTISVISTSLLTLSILSTGTVSANSLPVEDSNPKIERNKTSRRECLNKSLEELKNEGVFTQKDIDNINNYLTEMKSKKNQHNYCRGNKECKKTGELKKYNNDRQKSLVDNLVNDNIITKDQGDKLKERLVKIFQQTNK